ncbi:MAG: exodeoxyribonuclease VII large subunit [Desulfobacterales bacterium]|nr:exodeoxyribonuclease VII large subunit [Desulfobacterales bacterium]
MKNVIQPDTPQNIIYTVSKLTAGIKAVLEENFPFVWVTGEISNFSVPVSGHYYFTLKDEHAQISAVIFRGQNRNLKFVPADGMNVTGLGRISLYAPRGSYQVIFEYLEPKGIGEMQIAFEQLKTQLSEEGLFDEKHKQKLPFLPQKIAIITSPTGAVVHDIIKVTHRRYPNIHIKIIPVKVQGDGADKEIVSALELLNRRPDVDVAIMARGGGSLEDLNAFNTEIVARAIFRSKIPIISAIGHETDFTIADFVADLRAPTPSAAAELAVPVKHELKQLCHKLKNDIITFGYNNIDDYRIQLNQLMVRMVDPRKKLQELRFHADDLMLRLIRLTANALDRKRERISWWADRLRIINPQTQIYKLKDTVDRLKYNIQYYMRIYSNSKSSELEAQAARLRALSPIAILERGYSITRTVSDKTVVKSAESVEIGQNLDILLARGSLVCRVGRKSINGQKNI